MLNIDPLLKNEVTHDMKFVLFHVLLHKSAVKHKITDNVLAMEL